MATSKKPLLSRFQQNLGLIASFIGLISLTLFIGLFLGYRFTQQFVVSKFNADKADVLDNTMRPYNDLVFNRIPKISLYQGFLDSVSISKISANHLRNYPFIDYIQFYDIEISNREVADGFRIDRFSAGLKAVFKFQRQSLQPDVLYRQGNNTSYPLESTAEFGDALLKFSRYVMSSDSNKILTNDDIYKIFYTVNHGSISYLNVPRREEIIVYKNLMTNPNLPLSPLYDQDLVSYRFNPYNIQIKNTNPKLYSEIYIKPVIFDSLSTSKQHYTTGIVLPGAFAEHQLYFISSKQHIQKLVLRIFMPIAIFFFGIYLLMLLIGYLILRNLHINRKMFSLQYDFINNLTHEFKTPVSVIKIAGNNILSANELTERERKHYGKILDEEADKLNNLLTKLLSFTQLENRAIKIKYSKINMEVFIQNLIDEYQLKYPEFNIEYDLNDIEFIESDSVLLGSVFTNLMENAYKYSPSDRKYLSIYLKKIKKEVVIKFTDQGIGIADNELENVFKKFYKVDNEFNRHGSVGIGLSFCKEVVQFLDGNINVKSRIGKGTEFKIVLPLKLNNKI